MGPASLYATAVKIAVAQLTNTLTAILRANYDPDDREGSMDRITPIIADVVRQHRERVYKEAVKLLYDEATAHGVADPYIPDLTGYSERAVRTTLKRTLRGPADKAIADTTRSLAVHARAAGRQTIVRAVEDGAIPDPEPDVSTSKAEPARLADDEYIRDPDRQPKSWARVLTGEDNCGFCVMLASRGPVYSSAEDAGRLRASEAIRDAGALAYVNSYHPGCDCVVVPVYDYGNWPGRDSYKAVEKFYVEEINKKGITVGYNPLKEERNKRREADGKPPLEPVNNEVLSHLANTMRKYEREGKEPPFSTLDIGDIPGIGSWGKLPQQ